MAKTFYTNVAAAQTATATKKLMPTDLGGRLRIAHGSFTPTTEQAATTGSGCTIELVKLPAGARVLPVSRLHFEAGQSGSLSVTVGDAADPDRYLKAKVPGASEVTVVCDANRLADYILPTEQVITLTTTAAALTANKRIGFDFYYVVD